LVGLNPVGLKTTRLVVSAENTFTVKANVINNKICKLFMAVDLND
jgi:hypothetical protein